RVPVAARAAPGGDSRARPRRPAIAERNLLVGVRLLSARWGASTARHTYRTDAVRQVPLYQPRPDVALAPAVDALVGAGPPGRIPPAGSATAPSCGRSSRVPRGTGGG